MPTCERLMHHKKRGQTEYPYKCGQPAIRYEVSGQSFTAFATLCIKHAQKAQEEGFTLKEVRE